MKFIYWTRKNPELLEIKYMDDFPTIEEFEQYKKQKYDNFINQKYFYFMELDSFIHHIQESIINDYCQFESINEILQYDVSFFLNYKNIFVADLWWKLYNKYKSNFKKYLKFHITHHNSLFSFLNENNNYSELQNTFNNYTILIIDDFFSVFDNIFNIYQELEYKNYKMIFLDNTNHHIIEEQ
jgi:hypothetical protein